MPRTCISAVGRGLRCVLSVAMLFAGQGCRSQGLPKDALTEPAAPRYDRAAGPVPTHRFWSAKNWFALNLTAQGGPYTMFPEPLAVQTTPHGLLVGYSPQVLVAKDSYVHPVQQDFILGVPGLNATSVNVSGFTDRMVDFDFGPLRTRVGRGMPFVYVETTGADPTVSFNSPPQMFAQHGNLLGVTLGPNYYGLFCPTGGVWTGEDKVFTCHLPKGRHDLSIALLPHPGDFDVYARYAFAVPVETPLHWAYDRSTSEVSTTFEVVTELKEGTDPGFLQALYPHQYSSLIGEAASKDETYASARGPLHVLHAKGFTTVDTFHGVLPFLPLPEGFDAATERQLLGSVAAETNSFPAPDTYGLGKELGRMAQLLPLAQMTGSSATLAVFNASLRRQFDKWSAPGERKTNRFVYDEGWGTLIGYPASFGTNTQLNDHHFHYGYWIHSAALLGLYDPAWLHRQGNEAFVRDLIGDIATISPPEKLKDKRYPMLRHFDAYAGHSWASGQSPFGDGENQESTSEAINAWAGVILYASQVNDPALRDAAIWMYTLETNAANDYWFNDGPVSTFPVGFDRVQVTNVFDGKADAATWFGNAPEFEHGIQFLPFTGASLYLGRHPAYVERNLAEVTRANGGNIRQGADQWPDLMEMYQAFYDPAKALQQWRATGSTFDGESRAHEFAWLSSLAAYGRVDQDVTADTPFYAVFRGERGVRTHVAFNPEAGGLKVRFSDGVKVEVPGRSMVVEGRVLRLP